MNSTNAAKSGCLIGWASRDITPDKPVLLWGQFYARVSEGVMDPITVTALAIESSRDGKVSAQVVMVSCDSVSVPSVLLESVRAHLRLELPGLDPNNVFINATHTHTAPVANPAGGSGSGVLSTDVGFTTAELGVIEPEVYLAFVARSIADAVAEAWQKRKPGGIGYGLGHAVVGYNRRVAYFNGETRMYGNSNDPEFSHARLRPEHHC